MLIFKKHIRLLLFSALTFAKDSFPSEANDLDVHMTLGCRKIFSNAFTNYHLEKDVFKDYIIVIE